MSVLIRRYLAKAATTGLKLNRILVPAGPATIMNVSNMTMTNNGVNRHSSSSLKSEGNDDYAGPKEKYDYESAVVQLTTLVSNSEAVAAARRANIEKRRMTHVPITYDFILRSGLKDEDIDKMSLIHVSGTKGKGSACAFCERILHSKGYKTGLFSSPHLIEVRERIRINGRPVSKEVYAHHFWKVYKQLKATQVGDDDKLPGYFAFNMILALHIFLAEGVDVSIIEVGIGGQYDSTNWIRRPAVCGVTSLGLDHTAILGHTLEEIAWNKAGIFKTGCPAIVTGQAPAAMQVILDRAKERQSALYRALPIDTEVLEKENIHLGISGRKQRDNAGLAVQLVRLWEERHSKVSMEPVVCNVSDVSNIDEIPRLATSDVDNATAKGLSSCVWPGRAQTVSRPGVTYYLDGAHTVESIEVCSQWFKEACEEEMKSIKGKVVRVLIFNVTGERKPRPLLECLKGCSFDAAGFCTNTVSTVDTFNKKDQINPKYTSKVMVETAEANKLAWDSLFCSSESPMISDGCKPNAYKSPLHSRSTHTTSISVSSSHFSTNAANSGTDSSSLSQGALSRSYATSPTSVGNVHSTELIENGCNDDNNDSNGHNKINNNNDDNVNHNNYVQNKSPNVDSIISKQHLLTRNCSDGQSLSHSNKGYFPREGEEKKDLSPHPTSSSSNTLPTSEFFLCILQALVWATQSKDPSLVIKDPQALLPPIPSALEDADHVQVLVTGSLLLVGGVLGVITPHMND